MSDVNLEADATAAYTRVMSACTADGFSQSPPTARRARSST